MNKPRLALVIGIFAISVYPILIKLELAPGLISAFYRMAIALALLLPYAWYTKQLGVPSLEVLGLAALSGILFGADVAVWNISIQESTATQASLLTNLSPVWVGITTFLFLENKPTKNFWIGTVIALLGMVTLVGFGVFANFAFDRAFVFGVLSGIFYSGYLMVSKEALAKISIVTLMVYSLMASSLFLGLASWFWDEPFSGFGTAGWLLLGLQAVLCQLVAWLLVSFALQHMKTTRVSLAVLSQALISAFLAWVFLKEVITLQMILGGIILLFGIRVTFYNKPITIKRWLTKPPLVSNRSAAPQ
ncbi:DMT family transporter [Sediminicola arcticus]|jgi:drug/metabolite transporter (DMT)-like permease|uniref:DMT family transporter n=1 Tax=Sediminicola arcticus TaxID=1574308 RepID=A0ABV2SXD0_9FLAO